MHKLQRVIASLGVIAILSTLVISTAYAALPSDVPADEWYTPFVQELVDAEAIDATAKFNPSANTTRGEWVKWQVIFNEVPGTVPAEATFTDVPKDNPYFEYVEIAYANGIVNGYKDAEGELTGKFGPNDPVTREQAAKIIIESQALPIVEDTGIFPDEASFSDWFVDANYGSTIYAWSVMVGDSTTGKFRPQDKINHAEAAKVITIEPVLQDEYVTGDDDVVDDTDTTDDTADDDVVVTGGDLVVSLGEVITGDTLPNDATAVKVLNIDVTAGDEGGTLKTLKLHKFGVAAIPTGNALYIYEGSERLTNFKTINSTTNYATFNNLNLDVEAGETRHFTVRMDVGIVATTGELGLEIASAEDVEVTDAEATLDGTVKGEKFGLSTTLGGTLTVVKNGTVSGPSVGEKGATFSKFRITVATENASLEEVGLYIGAGSINTADMENFKLYVTGETDPIAEVAGVDSNDVAAFAIADGYDIANGDTVSFYATVDFNTGRTDDTVFVYINEDTDLVAIGDTYKYGMGVTRAGYDGLTALGVACAVATQTECNAFALEGGDITITGTTISNRNLAISQEDVPVMKFTIANASDSQVTFDNFAMHLDTGAAAELVSDDAGLWDDDDNASNFTDIKIKEVDGSHIWGPIDSDELLITSPAGTVMTDAEDANPGYYLFTDDLVLDAGESKDFELTFDVANNAALSNETLTATIDIDGTYPVLRDVNNKTLTNSTTLVPTADYAGDQFTVKTDALVISKGGAVGSKTVVIGSQNVEIGAFTFQAGDASDATVTEVNLTGYIDETSGGVAAFVAGVDNSVSFSEIVLGMDIYEGSVAAENKISSQPASANSTSGAIQFQNLSWDIAAGTTETLLVVATQFANNATYAADLVKVDIADVSADITAQNTKGNPITPSGDDIPNGGAVATSAAFTEMTVSGGGTLAIDVKSPTASSDIIVAGSTGNEMATLKFTATSESFVVNKMALRNTMPATILSDYDDNIASLYVTYYTDTAQTVEETTECTLSSVKTVWTCSGMSMLVPNPDLVGVPNYAYVTITADLNGLANTQADAGDAPLITFTPAADFEATGEESPTKVYEQTLIVTDIGATSTYQTFGSYATASDAVGADLATAADTILLLTDNDSYVAGTIICIDDEDTGCDATDEKAYVVARCTAADTPHDSCTLDNQVILKREILGTTLNAATAAADDIDVLVPTTILATNAMTVYGTKLAFAAGTPAHGGQNATEEVMKFTATAHANGDAQLRQGLVENFASDTLVAGAGTIVVTAETGEVTSGTRAMSISADAANDDFVYLAETTLGASANVANYDYVSFWVQVDADANVSITPAGLSFFTNDTADLVAGQLNEVLLTAGALEPAAFVVGTWYYLELPISPDAAAANYGIATTAVGTFDNALDEILIDDIIFFNERLRVDLSSNDDITAAGGTTAYLKQNGTVVATGSAVWYDAATPSYGTLNFVPTGTYGDLAINGTDTFTIETDTTVFSEVGTSTENFTYTIDLGGYGTTTGDLYWYDEEGASIVQFAGVSATDKISQTNSY